MRSYILSILAVAIFFTTASSVLAQKADDSSATSAVKADRWLELDLYWFDQDDIQGSVNKFWERYAPLFQGADGWHGVILNIGWTADYVVDWRGNLDQKIPFPVGFKQQEWFKVGGQLTGDTAERERQWQERFSKPEDFLRKNYDPWTYGDLKKLATALRQVAEQKYGLKGMRIGSLVVGWPGIYSGRSVWEKTHPDAYFGDWGGFNLGYILKADPTAYGAYPKGIPDGTPIYEYFGKQWGSMSKATGLDAIVLRDSFLLTRSYRRAGPFGPTAPSPEKAEEWTRDGASLVRITKQSNPKALVIGYSTGATAIADWRANCMDLESIVKQGYMDAFIDQTWGGGWNDVGTRSQGFWNTPDLGWTYQLAYMLMHGAILADTKVRHYQLTETFDAWECWDVIHTSPDRLKWGIWAYSHAAVKTPTGLKMPMGAYVTWGNQGTRLLSDEDVKFLADNLNAAYRDAAQVKDVYGPTLVYDREAMAWEMAHATGGLGIKEWLDEQVGTVMKWPVPIMSSTRLEWLPKVKSDLFFVQTPVHLSEKSRNTLVSLINSGQPVIACGSPVDGVDPAISKLIGIEALSTNRIAYATNAALAGQISGITDGLPTTFTTYQWWSQNQATGDGQVVYNVDGSPGLVLNTAKGHRVAFWDPPEFTAGPWFATPLLSKLGGSVAPYVSVARIANSFLADINAIHATEIDPDQAVAVESWGLKNGEVQILAGNLEEGLRDDADLSRHATLALPWRNCTLNESSAFGNNADGVQATLSGSDLNIYLKQAQAGLFTLKTNNSTE